MGNYHKASDDRGEGTAAAAIAAFAAIASAIIGGLFLLATTQSNESGGGGTADGGGTVAPTITAPNIDDFFSPASVFLSRDSGPGGTTVNVSGEGFQAGERVVIRFHTEEIGSTTANDAGSFSNVAVEIPDSFSQFAPKQFKIVAGGQSSIKSADAPFTLSG